MSKGFGTETRSAQKRAAVNFRRHQFQEDLKCFVDLNDFALGPNLESIEQRMSFEFC